MTCSNPKFVELVFSKRPILPAESIDLRGMSVTGGSVCAAPRVGEELPCPTLALPLPVEQPIAARLIL